MNVTQEVQKNHIIYGASDYTASHSLAASRSLNYAEGSSITKPAHQSCSVIPYTFRYEDAVGLFGVENYFTRVQLDITGDIVFACFAETGWTCANVANRGDSDAGYTTGLVDSFAACTDDPSGYLCAKTPGDRLPSLGADTYVSVDLKNLKTGNMNVDDWLDVRLYTMNREEHPYDRMWVRQQDYFYIGFHARNTRRLPFDVACVIGLEYADYNNIPDREMIMRQ
jgi:hypothetical protein